MNTAADKRSRHGSIHIPATRFTRPLSFAYAIRDEQGNFRPVVAIVAGIASAGHAPDGDYDIYIMGARNLHYRGGRAAR